MSKKIEELQQQVAELTDALQRERADSQNIRRRSDEQIGSLRITIKSNVIRDLLPVIDNFERSLGHVPKELAGSDFVKGIQGVVKQFEATLAAMGVTRIKTVGEIFDPRLHEAVHMDESSEALAEGEEAKLVETVSEELQSGYMVGEDVIRHAMVKVNMQIKKEEE